MDDSCSIYEWYNWVDSRSEINDKYYEWNRYWWIWLSSIDGDIWINYIWWCESKEVNVNSTMISIPISSHLSTSYSLLFHINPTIQASFHISSFRILWLKSILEWSEFKSAVIRYKYQQITKKRYTADNLLEYEFSWTLNTLLFCPYEFDSSFCSHYSW